MTARATILVVDDHTTVRRTVADILRGAGFAVIEAASGADALAHLAPPPDAIVLDRHLPDMSGLDVCRTLKAIPGTASMPVLMLSGVYTSEDDRSGGLETGADAYLTKPVTSRELLATVDSLLRARRQHGELERRARMMHEAQDALAAALLTSTLDLGEVAAVVDALHADPAPAPPASAPALDTTPAADRALIVDED